MVNNYFLSSVVVSRTEKFKSSCLEKFITKKERQMKLTRFKSIFFAGRDKTWGTPWPRPWGRLWGRPCPRRWGRPWGRPWPTGG